MGLYPGTGKSYLCEYMEKLGYNILVVCPTNQLAQDKHGITLNKFFSVGMTEDTKMNKFDDSKYDVIIFDELYFTNIDMLRRIKNYVDNNPDKIILGTGDQDQLEPVEQATNIKDPISYIQNCIYTIFPNYILLKETKRLKDEQQKNKLKLLKKELLNENNNVRKVLKKYFKFIDNIKTVNNISYTNNSCNKVSKVVRQNLNKKDDYEVNEYLVCRKYLKIKSHTFNVNFKYKIIKIDGNNISIIDETIPDKIHTLKIDVITNHFIHAYCRTCHSYQGSSIKDEITIFEWYLSFTSRKWIWTAITRTTDLDKVYIYMMVKLKVMMIK